MPQGLVQYDPGERPDAELLEGGGAEGPAGAL
jgi:hypothetical protein